MEKLKTISDIGVKMRSIRKSQHVSQETLAGLAGTGARYISELERGKESIHVGKLFKVLDVLGIGFELIAPEGV